MPKLHERNDVNPQTEESGHIQRDSTHITGSNGFYETDELTELSRQSKSRIFHKLTKLEAFCSAMSAKTAINKEIFVPRDEKMVAAAQVKRRTKKKIPFLATGGQGEYRTFICLSVTNSKPPQLYITKVKQFEGSATFARRSQWTVEQLRQVNGIDPKRDCAEFDLVFDGGSDQWQASSAGEKSTFIQILHHYCQRHCADRKPDFINCPSKLLREGQSVCSVVFRCKIFLSRMRNSMVSNQGRRLFEGASGLQAATDSVGGAVQKASQALSERGERLGRTEEKTEEMMDSASQLADTAHKLAMKSVLTPTPHNTEPVAPTPHNNIVAFAPIRGPSPQHRGHRPEVSPQRGRVIRDPSLQSTRDGALIRPACSLTNQERLNLLLGSEPGFQISRCHVGNGTAGAPHTDTLTPLRCEDKDTPHTVESPAVQRPQATSGADLNVAAAATVPPFGGRSDAAAVGRACRLFPSLHAGAPRGIEKARGSARCYGTSAGRSTSRRPVSPRTSSARLDLLSRAARDREGSVRVRVHQKCMQFCIRSDPAALPQEGDTHTQTVFDANTQSCCGCQINASLQLPAAQQQGQERVNTVQSTDELIRLIEGPGGAPAGPQ
ncbi:hypothetical protein AAFF_G00241650 [Aldrovandia affinis]|uniref:V-SNARE coiled-coil homology domain-containing protein n=1 Tax=Aldrovandia affinis TaxID=143900 RepID=A0AAD7SUQ3_9TELE|nr:hypothetical protein AAFF_G00241650 [Aldrovandia affinis]